MTSRLSGHQQLTAILALAALLGGCAVGRSYNFSDAAINMPGPAASASSTIAIAVQDKRAYVISGGKPEHFVGLMRGGYGNPFDVNTQSGGPLAVEMRDSLAKSLKGKGYTVTPVALPPSESASAARRKLGESGSRRIALVTLNEWKSDMMLNTDLHFDVTLAILNQKGDQLATNSVKGKDSLGRAGAEGVTGAFARKLEALFNDEKITAAMR